jgi:protein CpxP
MALKNKIISAITLVFAIVAFSTFVSAQDTTKEPTDQKSNREWRKGDGSGKRMGRGFRRGGKRQGMMRGLRGIDLTDAQKAQIKGIRDANKPSEALRTEMRTLVTAKRDGTITTEQQARLETLRGEAKEKGRLVREQVLAVLTVEQKQQIEQRKQEMRQRMEERRQQRQPRDTKPTEEKKDN